MLLFIPTVVVERGWRNIVLAVRSLWLHKLRALLSVLGIVIGTAAVIALMAFGEGSMQDALADIERQGATNIIVRSVKPPDESATQSRSFFAVYGLTEQDYERLHNIDTIIRDVPLRVFRQEIRYLGSMHVGRMVGTTQHYTIVHQTNPIAGRFLTADDEEFRRNHAVLGWTVAKQLFPLQNPLGETIVIGKHLYKVVGVMPERMPTGGSGGSQAAEEFNDDVYIPLSTCNSRVGARVFLRQTGSRSGEQVELHQVTLTVSNMDKVRPTADVVRDLLVRFHGPKKDWAMTVPLDRLDEAKRAKNRYKMLLVLIASISLLVGGIGIMNIMLATVTERTREIGIRRALGAKRRDITFQFLIEAVVQTGIGGILGVVLGLGIAIILPWLWQLITGSHLPAKIHEGSIGLSLGVSLVVGVLFGWYPAQRAAKLDPIEALRHV